MHHNIRLIKHFNLRDRSSQRNANARSRVQRRWRKDPASQVEHFRTSSLTICPGTLRSRNGTETCARRSGNSLRQAATADCRTTRTIQDQKRCQSTEGTPSFACQRLEHAANSQKPTEQELPKAFRLGSQRQDCADLGWSRQGLFLVSEEHSGSETRSAARTIQTEAENTSDGFAGKDTSGSR